MIFKAEKTKYTILLNNGCNSSIYPYLRSENGNENIICVSPLHGRSYIVKKTTNNRYIISKGNGLSYTQHSFIHTGEFGDNTLGLLLRKDAERDFLLGIEIEELGIKTNHMEYVLELDRTISLPQGRNISPILLQYNVECPYRICDAPFMTKEEIFKEVKKWETYNQESFDKYHLIAANVLIKNLRTLHNNNILHNAIHEQNYTWALELLDFELACSPKHPYTDADSMRYVRDLYPREIYQTYVIISYIANVLGENVDFDVIDRLFIRYGYDISKHAV